jgi:ribulose-5-phosphate 4-epimerase/fuculose-1-phosphate aldolase
MRALLLLLLVGVQAPSGVQKERMEARDMFVLDQAGNVVHTPEPRPPPYKAPKLSECAPLFTAVSQSDKGLPACLPACMFAVPICLPA